MLSYRFLASALHGRYIKMSSINNKGKTSVPINLNCLMDHILCHIALFWVYH